MVKHSNNMSVFDHFLGWALKGLTRGKLKFSSPTIFVNTEKLKKSKLRGMILAPKSGNRCHIWPELGPAQRFWVLEHTLLASGRNLYKFGFSDDFRGIELNLFVPICLILESKYDDESLRLLSFKLVFTQFISSYNLKLDEIKRCRQCFIEYMS